MAMTWMTSGAMSQTDFHSLAVFTLATTVFVRQQGCDAFVLGVDASEQHGFNTFPVNSNQPTQFLRVGLAHFDTCNNDQVILDAKGFVVPDSYQFDSSFGSANVNGTVEMQCDPTEGPRCEPFPLEVHLTWTGVGEITRVNAGVVGGDSHVGNIVACPSNFLGKLTAAESARPAQVTGEVDSEGTDLLTGATVLSAFLVKGSEIKLQVFPNGEAGPGFCLCTTPDCS